MSSNWPWDDLIPFYGFPALLWADEILTYRLLVENADAWAASMREILPREMTRPLVLIEAANEPAPVTAYLGALRADWPVILLADGASAADDRIRRTYRPNIVYRRGENGWTALIEAEDPIALHPDLAVLLSTSGTTGAPKLVRLSKENIASNATVIASYLEIDTSDRAISTLSFNYSYGMSVIHSHLFHGASVILTDLSVIDDAFSALSEKRGATSLALVPVQFDLLERSGFDGTRPPGLRYVTQAGGKLDEATAKRFARLSDAEGWKFYVMYGQTEAGPRMSYVPPKDLPDYSQSIGRPVPGGEFSLLSEGGDEIIGTGLAGELIFRGPGVMMGYATAREDLELPDVTPELHTGDIAERLDNGFYRIVGRASRFIKIYGLRISLDEIETTLRSRGFSVYCSGSDDNLVVFAAGGPDRDALSADLVKEYRLPRDTVRVEPMAEPPLLSSGKVDYKALAERAMALGPVPRQTDTSLLGVFSDALRMETIDQDKSFVALGGDSLSYLEVQMGLAFRLGEVPRNWERMPISKLLKLEPRGPIRHMWQPVPADLLGRFLALFTVIALHATSWPAGGGAFLLIALSGFSMARFQSDRLFAGDIAKVLGLVLAPIVVCYYIFITLVHLLWSPVDAEWFLMLGNFDRHVSPAGLLPYWFVCLYVQITLLAVLPFGSSRVRRIVSRAPFEAGLIVTLILIAASLMFELQDVPGQFRHHNPVLALQLFFVGWCAFYASTSTRKLLLTLLLVIDCGFFWADISPTVTLFVLIGMNAVIWGWRVPLPTGLGQVIMMVGSAAMFIYLAHMPMIYLVHALPDIPQLLTFLLAAVFSVGFGMALKECYFLMATAGRRLRTTAEPG